MKRVKYLLLCMIMLTGILAGCASKTPAAVNVGFLKGPTGIGAAWFMSEAENGAYDTEYAVTLESDASVIAASVISGDLDIAAVPTNVAAGIYNKTGGEVSILAVNTLGVLYIIENGDTVNSVADLSGRTIYATGQAANPEYVLDYILAQNGLEAGTDVFVEYMTPDEVVTHMMAKDADLCMLPVPFVTTLLMKDADARTALDLTDEWAAVSDGSVLTQGCLVVRNGALEDDAIADFLSAYEESIAYMSDEANIDEAAALTMEYGIIGSEEIAKAAIPDSNIVFIAGAEALKDCLAGYFDVLYAADPASIGGEIPDDGIYYAYTG
ncbi:MAG: ABC transporter substrate-binding protein [Clostridia bacterium]|nr:ABC transporter substrate-binding protein [Clostridia bacterium]